jgi:hypothetical protein
VGARLRAAPPDRLPEVVADAVMRSLRDYHAGHDPDDDAVTVCLDWRR